jgi:tRNA pseudouridine55 synthase
VTSHDVVAKVRRGFGVKKIGHAGTLDPMATGVLILCLGGATRLSEYVMQSTKQYRAGIRLGVTTDTYDAEGEVQSVRDASSIAFADVENALEGFRGDIQQVPPMYSAIKQGGRKLYDIARAGETVAREPRAVTIESLEVVDWKPPELTVDVRCSAGTYIRSLAYDLGEVLGVGAHLTALTRLASGSFQLENAVSLDELLSTADWQNRIIPPSVALSGWSTVHLGLDEVEHIQQGRAIPYSHRIEGLAFAYAPDGSLVAIVEMRNSLLHPHKVFS